MSVERLGSAARVLVREEIAAAHGREVSFVVRVDANGALTDARVVARGTIDAVLALPGAAERGEMLLHNHPSGFLEPSGADLHVAARLHDEGVGFGIVNNDVSTLYVVVECPRARAVKRLDALQIANLLTDSGPIARVLGSAAFEDRPGQRDMAAYIADAYNDGGIALLEAGTGVGKSFAYLVPALEWARENGERTVVSTNTINLQEQLVGKDLPILQRAFSTGDRTVTFALLKGWRNYLCLSRLEQARAGQESLFDAGRGAELEAIAGWASRTADGSLSDLVEEPSHEVWDAVAAESCARLVRGRRGRAHGSTERRLEGVRRRLGDELDGSHGRPGAGRAGADPHVPRDRPCPGRRAVPWAVCDAVRVRRADARAARRRLARHDARPARRLLARLGASRRGETDRADFRQRLPVPVHAGAAGAAQPRMGGG